jgi:hypothetical protein
VQVNIKRNEQIVALATSGLKNKAIARALADQYPSITPQQVARVLLRARTQARAANQEPIAIRSNHTDMDTVYRVLKRCREITVLHAAAEAAFPRRTVQRWRTKFGIDADLRAERAA